MALPLAAAFAVDMFMKNRAAKEAESDARREAQAGILTARARSLGAPTYGVGAAQTQRGLQDQEDKRRRENLGEVVSFLGGSMGGEGGARTGKDGWTPRPGGAVAQDLENNPAAVAADNASPYAGRQMGGGGSSTFEAYDKPIALDDPRATYGADRKTYAEIQASPELMSRRAGSPDPEDDARSRAALGMDLYGSAITEGESSRLGALSQESTPYGGGGSYEDPTRDPSAGVYEGGGELDEWIEGVEEPNADFMAGDLAGDPNSIDDSDEWTRRRKF